MTKYVISMAVILNVSQNAVEKWGELVREVGRVSKISGASW